MAAGKTMRDVAAPLVRSMMNDDASGPDVTRIMEAAAETPDATFRAAIQAITQFDARDVLPSMTVPVLCIAGGHDLNAAPPKVMEKLSTKIAKGEFQCMDHVGHFGWAEDPEEFNRRVLTFLKDRIPAVNDVIKNA